MKNCTQCGKELVDDAVVCTNCGCSTSVMKEDKVSIGLCILSFFIPLFGIIYWPLMRKETPKKARACGITAIVSWVVTFVTSFLPILFLLLLGAAA
ncbi:MAG: zinc ribbon domain-containing protein [Ruminococcaceae bacterium]|nr:zinc ribbon domain-containing protein [Oscillospiraceae bacterium]